jgi:hypothetical protein
MSTNENIGYHIEIDGNPVRFPNGAKIRFYDTEQFTGEQKADAYAVRWYPIEYAEGRVTITSGIHPRAMAFVRGAAKGALQC